MYEFKSRTKVTDFKALSNTSFLDAYNYLSAFGVEKYGYEYAIDFGEDAEGAARLVSEILTKVYGVSVEENVDMFTNVGHNIVTARNNWRKNHGYAFDDEKEDTSTTQNSGCMVAATALLVPAVYAVVKLLGTIL